MKNHHRLPALTLTAALALSLAAPALALESPDGWLFEDYAAGEDRAEDCTGEFLPADPFSDGLAEDGKEALDYYDGHDWDSDGWYDWDDVEEPTPQAPRLVVNGVEVTGAGFEAVDGVSYAASDWLDATLGTSYAALAGPEDAPAGHFMVPLRAAAAEAGWDVGWNQGENAVYLLDGEGLKGALREDMTALAAILTWALEHSRPQPGKSWQTTQTCALTLTLLNSLDGDEDYTANLTVETLARDGVVNCTLTLDAADLLRLARQELWDAAAQEAPQLTLQNLKTLLEGAKVNLIADQTTGTLSVNCPLLSLFDETIDPNTWYTLSLEAGLWSAESGDTSAAGALVDYFVNAQYDDLLEQSGQWWSSPEEAFAIFEENRGDFAALFGPATLTKRNGAATWALTTDGVNAWLAQKAGEEAAPFRKFDVKCVMKPDGGFSCDLTIRPHMEGLAAAAGASSGLSDLLAASVLSWFDFQLDAHSAGTADKSAGTVDYHQKNAFKLHLESQARRRQTDALPLSQPPAGAVLEAM